MTEQVTDLPVKEMLTMASPFIKSIVDTFVTPKLEKLKARFGHDYKKYHVLTEDHFQEYFHRTYKRIGIVNTLVFNNSQKLLKDIYLPLTISREQGREKFKINKFPEILINKYEKILITDNAGMGKSTLVKKMYMDTIDSKKGIPILIELRRLNKEKSILKEIQEQINSLDKDFDNTLLISLIADGGFIFFLDGYDEISLSEREAVTSDIQLFVSKSSKNKFILTSRPESALLSFGDFKEFSIEPLTKKEAYELLRKYDSQGVVSKLLIKKLGETEMDNLEEFLTNPLLVSLLFTAFQHKQTIPFKKYIFYRQVYDANFESHDLTKGDSYTHGKYSKLEIDDFHRVLRHIGFSCLKNNQRIEFNKDELLDLIRKAKLFCVELDFSESDFLKDLLSTVPLFLQDGNYYRWTHKSLQEYFSAQFIYLDAKGQQEKILMQIYNNNGIDKFINVLDLYYDIDTKTFRKTILFEYLKTFELHHKNYLSGLATDLDPAEIDIRKSLCFLKRPFVFSMHRTAGKFKIPPSTDKMIGEIKRVSGRLGSLEHDKNLYCLSSHDEKYSLTDLLSRKIPSLFKFDITNKNELDERPSINFTLSQNDTPYFLTEEETDPLNSLENFAAVNDFVKFSSIQNYLISSAESLKLLNVIRNEIELEKDENFLLDGI